MLSLPPLPPTVRSLTDAESARLHRVIPDLQTSLEDCRTCHGTKTFRWVVDPFVPVDKAEIDDYECDCRAQFRLSRYLLAHNLGSVAARWCWGDAQHVPVDVLAELMGYATNCQRYADQGMGLYLYSPGYGTGKSLVATMILKAFLAAGIEGYWTTFAQLLTVYMGTFRDEQERAWFDRHIRNAPVLVIDDLGKEAKGLKDTTDPALDTLLRTRVQNGRTTIITSNISQEQVFESYTAALGSLVSEAAIVYEFPSGGGTDWRRWAADRKIWELNNGITRPWMLA